MTIPRDEKTESTPAAKTPDTGRRRFVVGGIAAAPILMTLAARPARAQSLTTTYGTNYVSGTGTSGTTAIDSFPSPRPGRGNGRIR